MEDSSLLIGFLVCCILLLGLMLCYKCRCCARLKTENRILRWFFKQQAKVDANYRKAYQAMHREVTCAKNDQK